MKEFGNKFFALKFDGKAKTQLTQLKYTDLKIDGVSTISDIRKNDKEIIEFLSSMKVKEIMNQEDGSSEDNKKDTNTYLYVKNTRITFFNCLEKRMFFPPPEINLSKLQELKLSIYLKEKDVAYLEEWMSQKISRKYLRNFDLVIRITEEEKLNGQE